MSDQENKMETDKVADDDSVKTEEEKPEEKEENEKELVKEEEKEEEQQQNEEKSEETESEKDKKEEEKAEANEVKKKQRAKKEEAPTKEVPSTPKKESDVPLYDQPLEMSGKRDRKKVERFVQETKKEELSIEGTGVPLGDIPFIDSMISKMAVEELKVLHRVAFNRPGSGAEIKKNLRKFNGFPYSKDDKKYQSKQMTVERILMSELKKILMVLGLERSGNKGEVVERLMAFMVQPEDFGRKPVALKKGKARGRPKKGRGKKQNNTSRDDSEGSRSESEHDEEEEEEDDEEKEEEEEEEEEEERPKKKPGRKPAAGKKASAKRTPAPKRTPATKRTKPAQASDDSDSDDEPLAKKVKQPPTDAELKVMVKKILEGANLEEVTMKSVCRQVYDSYPDFDLTHKKVFIKDTVRSIIS